MADNKPQRPTPARFALRVGVIQSGRIIDEKVVTDDGPVTIGSSPRSTISIAAANLPSRAVVFERRDGDTALVVGELAGRISRDGDLQSFADLRRADAGPRVPLSHNARGKAFVGDVTLLFQVVPAPPARARPSLPPSIRGSVFGRVDWTLASAFAVMLAINFGGIAYVRAMDIDIQRPVDVVPDDFPARPLVEPPWMPIPKAPAPKTPASPSRVETPAKPRTQSPPRVARPRRPVAKPCDAACGKRRRARLAKTVRRQVKLLFIGRRGEGGKGPMDQLIDGDPSDEIAKAFDSASGVSVASARDTSLRISDGNVGKTATVGALVGGPSGPKSVETGGKVVERALPKVSVRPGPAKADGLDRAAAMRVVRRGMSALRTCYDRAVKRDPTLAGKLVPRLTINTLGRVSDVAFDADSLGSAPVAACVKRYAGRWRFPPPSGGPAELVVPLIFETALRSDAM